MKLLDVVALTEDIPERCLLSGHVGTIVEQLTPEVFEVEFADINGGRIAPKTQIIIGDETGARQQASIDRTVD
ncbi:MAG: DUF4926 domain-containing protein [Gammaproteobacteria bacterium]